jgi:hypothetical protein
VPLGKIQELAVLLLTLLPMTSPEKALVSLDTVPYDLETGNLFISFDRFKITGFLFILFVQLFESSRVKAVRTILPPLENMPLKGLDGRTIVFLNNYVGMPTVRGS